MDVTVPDARDEERAGDCELDGEDADRALAVPAPPVVASDAALARARSGPNSRLALPAGVSEGVTAAPPPAPASAGLRVPAESGSVIARSWPATCADRCLTLDDRPC